MATKKKVTGVQTLSIPERVVTIKNKAQVVYRPFNSNLNYAIRFNSAYGRFEETDNLTSYSPQWTELSWNGFDGNPETSTERVKHLRNLIKLIQETK